MKDKTVYVLGAGFSIDANAPAQEKLVEKIFELHEKNPDIYAKGAVDKFEKFLTKILFIPKEKLKEVPLEDIFTPLDRCLMDNVSFRGLHTDEIVKTRKNIYYLIAETLNKLLSSSDKEYINQFGDFLVNKATKRAGYNYRKVDPVSIISMNWDILLDNSLKNSIERLVENPKGVVDYCCYISSFDENDHSIKPGLEILGGGGFNIKLLKLHGSLNWLHCPRCYSLFVGFDEKISLLEFYNKQSCRHCDKNFKNEKTFLSSNLIMPTFLKNLSTPQLKLIWQNAGVEFAEATRIVFIGYSLPQADFEMRQLLSRMVGKDTLIEVVDYGNENEPKINDLKKRYSIFFGSRKVNFHLDGAKCFIMKEIKS